MVNWKKLVKQIPHKIQASKDVFYDVVWSKSFDDPKLLGLTDHNKRIIYLREGQSSRDTIHTWIHECVHLFCDHYEVPMSESNVIKLEKATYFLLKKDNIFNGEQCSNSKKKRRSFRRIRKACKKIR